jgi:hypothetical protein
MRSFNFHLRVLLWLVSSQTPDARFARAVFKAGLLRRWSAFKRGLSLNAAIFAVRDALTLSKVARNAALNLGSLAAPAGGAAFTQANGQSIAIGNAARFGLLVYNSKAGAIVITVKAGDPAAGAESSGLGDYSYTCPTTVFFTLIGPLESARFAQVGGKIFVDTDAGAPGTMWAFEYAD